VEAILLVGHGSRDNEGNEEMLRFADSVRSSAKGRWVETCFLEFVSPTIPQGIARCVEAGATRIVLVPIILFAAGHSKIHIPHEIDHAKLKYPNVSFAYGQPIGIHQKVLDILASRLTEAGYSTDKETSERDQDTAVLLLGRGSSDVDANSNFLKMARLLWERLPVKWVESSFIGVTEPSFPEGLERCKLLGAKKIYVLPYFLFTGVLIKRIEQMTAEFAEAHPNIDVELAGYFGFHPQLVELLIDRVEEASEGRALMNCDMCKYRTEAAKHHDHDHGHSHDHHHDHDHGHSHDHHHDHYDKHAHGHDHHHDHDNDQKHDHEHGHGHDDNDQRDHQPPEKREVVS
jgi:sirohydrochlorin cobaltochelatase